MIYLLIYFFIVFILIRLIIPHFGFTKSKLPLTIPDSLQNQINLLNSKSKNDLDFLKNSYEYIVSKYSGHRYKTFTNFWICFQSPLEVKPGFAQCNIQNYLLRTILVKSGRFTEDQIKIETVPLNFIIHQYLKVKVDNNWIYVDPWSKFLEVPFGSRAFIFA